MSAPAEVAAALDIGGTKTAAGLVDATGTIVARAVTPTPARAGATAVLDTAADLVAQLRAAHPGLEPRGLGVGSAGVLDPTSGRVVSATDSLTGWVGTEVAAELRARTGLPTYAVNDVHAHALGEAAADAGRAQSILAVAVGTGIGAGHVVAGRIHTGATGAAGHLGHVPVAAATELLCPCGRTGHLEALASGPGLITEYARRTGTRPHDLQTLGQRAGEGDQAAQAVLALGGEAVGQVIGGLVNVLDPDVVVVGGGVSALGAPWWDPLVTAATAQLIPAVAAVRLRRSTLGGDAALLGAARLTGQDPS